MDGVPLCLFCKGPVDFVDKLKCTDWDARFCSYDCKKEHQVINNNNLRLNYKTGQISVTIIFWVSVRKFRGLLNTHAYIS